jgi:NAD(P)-dependent dehydrogenase (short-subunit alcohol dehydrogenase family)
LEGAPHGVTCNAISPTWVDTTFGREWMSDIAAKQENRSGAEYITDVEKTNPQGRLISPTEIGALALFLCSDAAHGITMEDLRVSAGSLW